ncbi:hypothetical protein D3C72_1676510 [compost metagenome]
MQLAAGWVVEAQLQFGVLLHPHAAERGSDAVLQVVAEAEGLVLEARTRQRGTRHHAGIEHRFGHEQVVVAGVAEDVPGLALDQVAEHVVGHPPAQAAAAVVQRQVEHQRHFIVKARRGRPQLFGDGIVVGAVQETLAQAAL